MFLSNLPFSSRYLFWRLGVFFLSLCCIVIAIIQRSLYSRYLERFDEKHSVHSNFSDLEKDCYKKFLEDSLFDVLSPMTLLLEPGPNGLSIKYLLLLSTGASIALKEILITDSSSDHNYYFLASELYRVQLVLTGLAFIHIFIHLSQYWNFIVVLSQLNTYRRPTTDSRV